MSCLRGREAGSWLTPAPAGVHRNSCVGVPEKTESASPSSTRRTAADRSAGSMNALVHCTSTTTSGSSSSESSACSTADSLEAVAPLSSAGRSTTRAPARRAASAMPAWSVLTTTSSTGSARRQARTARATSGTPPTGARFFSGTPAEPPRAGTTARTRNVSPLCLPGCIQKLEAPVELAASPCLTFRGGRQAQHETGALGVAVGAVLDPDLAAVRQRHVAGDRQAQPGAAGVAAAGGVEPGEPLEDALAVRHGDRRAVVLHGQHRLAVLPRHLDRHLALGVPLGVVQQVAQQPGQLELDPVHDDVL